MAKKYPEIKIEKPAIGPGFLLRGYCKPSFFKKKRELYIQGHHDPFDGNKLKVYEILKIGIYDEYSKLIAVYAPDEKKDRLVPKYQKKLEDLLNEIGKKG